MPPLQLKWQSPFVESWTAVWKSLSESAQRVISWARRDALTRFIQEQPRLPNSICREGTRY
jgi:hypothetical protein